MAGSNDWRSRPLRDCAIWYSGGTPNKATASYWGGTIPWISAKSLTNFFIAESEDCVTEVGARNGTRLVPKDSILFIVRGMSLKSEFRMGITTVPVTFNQDLKALVAVDDIVPTFLAYAIKARTDEILGLVGEAGHGTGVLPTDRIQALEIPIPSLPEQRAIASVLGTIDDKINLNRRMNETLEAMARALFKSWFVDFDPVRAKAEGRRPSGMDAETAKLFPSELAESDLGEIPKGWRIVELSEVAAIASGKRPTERYDVPTSRASVPLFGGGGVMAYVSEPLLAERAILTGRVGTLGLLFRVTEPCWPSDNTLIVRTHNAFDYDFVRFQLEQVDFASLNRGSTQPLLAQRDLGAQRFVLPSDGVRAAFAARVEEWLRLAKCRSDESGTLSRVRDALLPRLLSGELRVNDEDRSIERAGT